MLPAAGSCVTDSIPQLSEVPTVLKRSGIVPEHAPGVLFIVTDAPHATVGGWLSSTSIRYEHRAMSSTPFSWTNTTVYMPGVKVRSRLAVISDQPEGSNVAKGVVTWEPDLM